MCTGPVGWTFCEPLYEPLYKRYESGYSRESGHFLPAQTPCRKNVLYLTGSPVRVLKIQGRDPGRHWTQTQSISFRSLGVGHPKAWAAQRALGCPVRAQAAILGGHDGARWIHRSGWKEADERRGQKDGSAPENRKSTEQLPRIPPPPGASWGSLDFLQAEFMEPPWFLAGQPLSLISPRGLPGALTANLQTKKRTL